MQHAIEIGWRTDNPAREIKPLRVTSVGFHSWTETEIEQFEKAYPIGTRARLALALFLYTGQRVSDVVRMGRQHLDDGMLRVRQQKTGTELMIPITTPLAEAIVTLPSNNLTFLTTQTGKPFLSASLGSYFKQLCVDAGLPHCSAHGLRKAAARRLAEGGCSEHEIAAITGHASLKEVQRYTRGADQKRLAISAMAKIKQIKQST
jgi:integrase